MQLTKTRYTKAGCRYIRKSASICWHMQIHTTDSYQQLTYCCRAVLQTAMKAAIKPFVFTLTSVTVQIATPSRTNKMLNLVSLEYRTLSSTISKKHDTGIILSFAIWWEFSRGNEMWDQNSRQVEHKYLMILHTYLIKPNRVPH